MGDALPDFFIGRTDKTFNSAGGCFRQRSASVYERYILNRQELISLTGETKTPAVSVVIPIYNVEKFLRGCLNSLAAQTMRDFEVIMVNDGSTDGSLSIMREFCEKYPWFHLIDKENGGVSSARNAGVQAASGEYIAFLDSDDTIAPHYLHKLYQAAVETKADVICCDFTFYYPQKEKYRKRRSAPRRGVFPTHKPLRWMLSDWSMRYFLWNKLWRRTLFTEHDIAFPLHYFEDCATSPRLMFFANQVAVIEEFGYYYTQHNASILGSINANKINDHIRSVGIVRNFFMQQHSYETYRHRFYWYGWKAILTNWYNITWMHLSAQNFQYFWKNLRAATKAIRYYQSNKFLPVDKTDDFPGPIIGPSKKRISK